MAESQGSIKLATMYARVSNNDHGAILAQLDHMRRQAEKYGLEPSIQFTDMNGSRAEFDWMMAQATSANPPFRHILVYNNSRFSRSLKDWQRWRAELEANGVRVISIKEPLASDPM